jgi:uncharacterized DUF497 family protein
MNQDIDLLKRACIRGTFTSRSWYYRFRKVFSSILYIAVYFIYKKNKKALIITARDMTEKERKRYAKK